MEIDAIDTANCDWMDFDDDVPEGELQGRTVVAVATDDPRIIQVVLTAILKKALETTGMPRANPIERNVLIQYDFKRKHENKYEKQIRQLEESMPDKNQDRYKYYAYKARIETLWSYRYRDLALENSWCHPLDALKYTSRMLEHEKRAEEYMHEARKAHGKLVKNGVDVGPFCVEWIVSDDGKGIAIKWGINF